MKLPWQRPTFILEKLKGKINKDELMLALSTDLSSINSTYIQRSVLAFIIILSFTVLFIEFKTPFYDILIFILGTFIVLECAFLYEHDKNSTELLNKYFNMKRIRKYKKIPRSNHRILIDKSKDYIKNIKKIKSHLWFIIALVLFLSLFSVTYLIIDDLYSPKLPMYYKIQIGNTIVYTWCKSANNLSTYVVRDHLHCKISLEGFNRSLIEGINAVEVDYRAYPEEKKYYRPIYMYPPNETEKTWYTSLVAVLIEKEGLSEFSLFLLKDFRGETSYENTNIQTGFMDIEAIRYADYIKKPVEKNTLLISALGIIFAVSFVGVKNFRDLWENK